MQVCHSFVERILQESLELVGIQPGTSPVLPTLDPPAVLDMAPMFADDSTWGGRSQEVHRCLSHLAIVMPRVGLRYSKLDVVPAAGFNTLVDTEAFVDLGCKVILDKSVAVMKSPMGRDSFCAEQVSKRVAKAVEAITAIADLPDKHSALYLLRYQIGRLDYLVRTTPSLASTLILCTPFRILQLAR